MLPPLYMAIAGVSSLPVGIPMLKETFSMRAFARSNGAIAPRLQLWLVASKGAEHKPLFENMASNQIGKYTKLAAMGQYKANGHRNVCTPQIFHTPPNLFWLCDWRV